MATESPNPFEAYQGEEVTTASVKAATADPEPGTSMIAVGLLILIAAILAFIAVRHRK